MGLTIAIDRTPPSVKTEKKAIEALKLISDNATNGDVIKALFPQIETKELTKAVVLTIHNTFSASCDIDWWNAPYKREFKISVN